VKRNNNSHSASVNLQEILDRLNLITQNSTGKTKEDLNSLLQDVKDSAIDPHKLARDVYQNAWKA